MIHLKSVECLGVFENSNSPDVYSGKRFLAVRAASVQIHIFFTYYVFEKSHLYKLEKLCSLPWKNDVGLDSHLSVSF